MVRSDGADRHFLLIVEGCSAAKRGRLRPRFALRESGLPRGSSNGPPIFGARRMHPSGCDRWARQVPIKSAR